jgi:hypothetical protein
LFLRVDVVLIFIRFDLLEASVRDGHCLNAVDWTSVGTPRMTS